MTTQMLLPRGSNLEFIKAAGNRMLAIEPDYKNLLPPIQLRRMSKVVKMGIAAAKNALLDAEISSPDIIITGTGYGCLADTEAFLQKMISQNESLLTPTSFIQSTHNTVSGQIALLLTCHGHNFTYVQRGLSFEFALQESMLWLAENEQLQVLTGGIDEMTNHTFDIISRFGSYKNENETYDTDAKGSIAGEGAHLFVISAQKTERSYAELVDLKICHTENISSALHEFLQQNSLSLEDIDYCLIGTNGDARYDSIIRQNMNPLTHSTFIDFKKWSGEYPTASSFAFALACNLCYTASIPSDGKNKDHKPKNVLIYNHYKNQSHSFILLRAL
nr:beta-ketoacyl synthase chain length factor [Chitinophagaceae bacterium]